MKFQTLYINITKIIIVLVLFYNNKKNSKKKKKKGEVNSLILLTSYFLLVCVGYCSKPQTYSVPAVTQYRRMEKVIIILLMIIVIKKLKIFFLKAWEKSKGVKINELNNENSKRTKMKTK